MRFPEFKRKVTRKKAKGGGLPCSEAEPESWQTGGTASLWQ
jgi:hypothetical protein